MGTKKARVLGIKGPKGVPRWANSQKRWFLAHLAVPLGLLMAQTFYKGE